MFPSQPPLWLPLANIRLFALLPEARGYLVKRAIAMELIERKGIFMPDMLDVRQTDLVRNRIRSLCAFDMENAKTTNWILEAKSPNLYHLKAYSPYIFVRVNNEKYPAKLECNKSQAELTYELYVSLAQDGKRLTISAPGANLSSEKHEIFGKQVTSAKTSLAVYRCDEALRLFLNAQLSRESWREIHLGVLLPAGSGLICSHKSLSSWLVYSFKQIVKLESHYKTINLDAAKKNIDQLSTGPDFPAAETATFRQIYEYLFFNILNGEPVANVSFRVSGPCVLNGKDETFEFCIPVLPEEFDLAKPLSSSIKNYLEEKPFNQFYQMTGRPIKKEGIMERVEIWDIKYPNFFLKSYLSNTNESIKSYIPILPTYLAHD